MLVFNRRDLIILFNNILVDNSNISMCLELVINYYISTIIIDHLIKLNQKLPFVQGPQSYKLYKSQYNKISNEL